MKSFAFWRYFLFATTFLVAVLLITGVWNAFAAQTSPTEPIAVTATEVTPNVTPTPLVAQSADTGGVVLFALVLLVVILGGLALGWWLMAAEPKKVAVEKKTAPAVGEKGSPRSKKAGGRRAL